MSGLQQRRSRHSRLASAVVNSDRSRFDPGQVHAALRQAVAETNRLKARAAAHAKTEAVLDATLRRLRHADPHGLHAATSDQLRTEFVADLAEAMAALRDTATSPADPA